MPISVYNSQLVVDTQKLAHNVAYLQGQLGDKTQLIAVLKCNAYGIGAVQTATFLHHKCGINTIALAQVSEGDELRNAGLNVVRLLILGGIPQHLLPLAVEKNMEVTLFNIEDARRLSEETARQGRQSHPVHIKLETGLHRLGTPPGPGLQTLAEEILRLGNLHVVGVSSHFADGESQNSPLARQQLALYHQGVNQLVSMGFSGFTRHICASGASEWMEDSYLDAVRLGRRLYMDAPLLPGAAAPCGHIQEVCSWRAGVVAVKQVAAGQTIGYSNRFVAPHDMTVAIAGVGYGDGLLPGVVYGGAPVLLNGRRTRYVGTCMDQCFIDATGIACRPGDEVTLFGHSSCGAFLSSQEVAAAVQDEGVFLTTFLSKRVERVYLP